MKNLIKAVLTALLVFNISFVISQTSYVGSWHSGTGHSVEFFTDGSFLEIDGGITRTGLYTTKTDGTMTLTYTPLGLPSSVAVVNNVTLDGNNLTWYINGSPMTFSRSYTTTYIPSMTNTLSTSPAVVSTSPGLSGTWYSSLDGDHSIEFFSDGSYLERNNGIVSSGKYSIGSDGSMSLTYIDGTAPRTVIYDRFALNGNNITWYLGDTPMTFTRTYTTDTYIPPMTNTFSSPPPLNLHGMWRMSNDGNHSIQFMGKKSFREVRNGVEYSGTWSIDGDELMLHYTAPSVSVSTYDRVRLSDGELIWYSDDDEIRWIRGMK